MISMMLRLMFPPWWGVTECYVSLIHKKFCWGTIFPIGLKRYRDPKEEPIEKEPLMELKEIGKLNQEKVLELQDGVVDSPGQDGRLSNGHNLEDKEITALCWASSNGTVLAVGYLDRDIMFWKTSTTASGKGPKCSACFQIFDSPVQALHYVDDGAKLAVSCECGRVVVLDMDAFSVSFVYNRDHVKSPKGARLKDLDKPVNKLMFVCQLKKDTTAISMHVIVVRVLGMAELKVSLTKAYNEDNRRKKQMVYLRIILDLQIAASI
ncbi:synaptobrevin, WD40/YVTN repeat-like-containing domain protein [Tanacetum coccineum]